MASRIASPLALLAVLALAAAAPSARAADDLVWGLAPGEIVRYDCKPDAPEDPDPQARRGLAVSEPDAVRLLRQDDLERGKRLLGSASRIEDLVWTTALSLPEGTPTAKRGSVAVEEKHERAGLFVRGTDEIALEGGRAVCKATLAVATEPPPKPDGYGFLAGTTLVVVRSFDLATRRVLDASYALEARQLASGKTHSWRISGKIAYSGQVDSGSRAFLASVQKAIARGARNLRGELNRHIQSRQNPPAGQAQGTRSYELGYAALGTFALLRSGASPESLEEAFAFMEGCAWTEVYSVSLYLMCLEARSVRREAVPPEDGGRTVARYSREPIPEKDKALMSKAAEWLIAARMRGAWTYHPAKGQMGGDRSNSQFAALALHVAVTNGVKLDPQVFLDMADEIVGAQEGKGPARTLRGCTFTAAAPRGLVPGAPKGGGTGMRETPAPAQERGWGYGMNTRCTEGTAYGSMTGAGVSSAVVAREALRRAGRLDGERDEKTRRAILDGIAWLARHFTPGRNPGNAGFIEPYYWLYSLEKAMELSGCESLAGHDWWHEGAAHLLATQEKDGGWGGRGYSSLSDTALALLFLNRATLPTRIAVEARPTVSSGKDDPSAWDLVQVPGTGFVHVAQVLDALLAAAADEVREVLRVAEKAYDEMPEEGRPRLVPRLARVVLAAEAPPARAFAKRALKTASGGLEDPAKALAFHDRWLEATRAGETGRHAAIPTLQDTFAAKDATPPLRRAALVSLARLRAVESIPALLDALSGGDAAWRKEVFTALVSIAGAERRPYDPAASAPERAKQVDAWRAWWREEGPALVEAETERRKAKPAEER